MYRSVSVCLVGFTTTHTHYLDGHIINEESIYFRTLLDSKVFD